jgi:hypothetical protein
MTDPDDDPARPRGRPPTAILLLAGIGAAKAAAWNHYRRQQPQIDAETRARLQPLGTRP